MLEILANVGFDWRVALFNFINFLIIFLLIRHFLFGPIGKLIKEREDKIKDGLEKSKAGEAALIVAEEQAKKIINQAKVEANDLVAKAHLVGEKVKADSEAEAMIEKNKILKDGELALKDLRSKAEKDFELKMVDLVVAGAEKVIKEEIKQKGNDYFIDILTEKKYGK